jgi:hypothetical protein
MPLICAAVPLITIGMLLTAAGVYGVLAFRLPLEGVAVRIAVGASAAI